MFTLEMLAADYGDALWLEYGEERAPKVVAIDGGPQRTASPLLERLRERAGAGPFHVELLVVTHVDADHIDGALAAIECLPPGVTFGDIWFNGFRHLAPPDQLGPSTGERLSQRLQNLGLPWNKLFNGGPVVAETIGPISQVQLNGGLTLTILSPTRDRLLALQKVWKAVLKKSGLATDQLGDIAPDEQESDPTAAQDLLGKTDTWPPDINTLSNKEAKKDTAQANGSSIGLLAEYRTGEQTHSVLLAGDCFPWILEESIDRILAARRKERLTLDAFKLPHHGSRFNLTNSLLKRLKCTRYLVSTSGARFRHPDHEALARVIRHGGSNPQLLFNYDAETTAAWKSPPNGAPKYRTRYGNGSLKVEIDGATADPE